MYKMEAENAVVMANLKCYFLDVSRELVILVSFTVQGTVFIPYFSCIVLFIVYG